MNLQNTNTGPRIQKPLDRGVVNLHTYTHTPAMCTSTQISEGFQIK